MRLHKKTTHWVPHPKWLTKWDFKILCLKQSASKCQSATPFVSENCKFSVNYSLRSRGIWWQLLLSASSLAHGMHFLQMHNSGLFSAREYSKRGHKRMLAIYSRLAYRTTFWLVNRPEKAQAPLVQPCVFYHNPAAAGGRNLAQH